VDQTRKCYHVRRGREARAVRALSDRNKLRRNFFRPVAIETNFAFGPAALRHATCELNWLIKLRRCLKAREAMIVFQGSVTKKNDQENEKPAGHSGLSSNFANFGKSGAGEGIRTLDPDLGKVVLYH
jgi:hypothetical protein